MRGIHNEDGTSIFLSPEETRDWANRPGARWPCSRISGRALSAHWDSRGNLVDYDLDGGEHDIDLSASEFNAITSDFLRETYGPDHPAIRTEA